MQILENTSHRLQLKFSGEFRTHYCGIILLAIPIISFLVLLLVVLLEDYNYTLTCRLLPSRSGTTCQAEVSSLLGQSKSAIEVENVTQTKVRSRRRATQSGSVTFYEVVFVTESGQQHLSGFSSNNHEEQEKRVTSINQYLGDPVASGLEIKNKISGLWLAFSLLFFYGIFAYFSTPMLKEAIKEKRTKACLFDRVTGKFIITEGNVLGQIVKREYRLDEIERAGVVEGQFEDNRICPTVTIIGSPTNIIYSTVLIMKSNTIRLLNSKDFKGQLKTAKLINQFIAPTKDTGL